MLYEVITKNKIAPKIVEIAVIKTGMEPKEAFGFEIAFCITAIFGIFYSKIGKK